MRAPGRSKVRQQGAPDRLHTDGGRESVRGQQWASLPRTALKVAQPLGGGAGLLRGPLHPSRGLLFRAPPSFAIQVSLAPRSPIRLGPLLHFLCLKQGGGSLGTKVSLCFGLSCLPPVLLLIPSLGRAPGAWRGLGSKRVSQLCPCPTPCSLTGHPISLNELPKTELPASLQVGPLSQELALKTEVNLQPRRRVYEEALASL